jgi:hypothetical protein
MTIEIEAGASQNQCSMKTLCRPSFFERRLLIPVVVNDAFPRLLKPLVVAIRVTAHKNLAR